MNLSLYDANNIAQVWIKEGYTEANELFNTITAQRKLTTVEAIMLRDKVANRKITLTGVV